MRKDEDIFLNHILESIGYIEGSFKFLFKGWFGRRGAKPFTKNVTKSGFLHNVQLQDAVIRRLEVIGEATKNLSKDFRRKYPHVRWEDIAGMRDKLIHHYFGVDLKITWNVVQKDIPFLKKNILAMIKEK